jgi:hypothetical protein
MPSHIYARARELRREIAEIEAADILDRYSGAAKVKHDKRIQRLWEIRNELFALINSMISFSRCNSKTLRDVTTWPPRDRSPIKGETHRGERITPQFANLHRARQRSAWLLSYSTKNPLKRASSAGVQLIKL